jgi:hypothetical protein
MQKLIRGWAHRPGRHCASTVLSDLTHFYGPGLSEPLCFGLGAGLGFYYLEGDFFSPTRMIMTRSQLLEPNFFHSLGLKFDWLTEPDPAAGWDAIKKQTDAGIPVLLRADIFHLDYYHSKTHFPFHIILFWGYDDKKNTVFIADTGWEGLQEIPAASLSNARYVKLPYHQAQGEYFPVMLPESFKGLGEKAKKALMMQAAHMNGQNGNDTNAYRWMRKVAERILQWPAANDSSWCLRWAYQTIEKRGTGGGGFRKMYADFLEELCAMDPAVRGVANPAEMARIGVRWTELSMLLKEASEKKPVPESDLKIASAIFSELAEREQELFSRAVNKLEQAG